jgi:hypothetical protein
MPPTAPWGRAPWPVVAPGQSRVTPLACRATGSYNTPSAGLAERGECPHSTPRCHAPWPVVAPGQSRVTPLLTGLTTPPLLGSQRGVNAPHSTVGPRALAGGRTGAVQGRAARMPCNLVLQHTPRREVCECPSTRHMPMPCHASHALQALPRSWRTSLLLSSPLLEDSSHSGHRQFGPLSGPPRSRAGGHRDRVRVTPWAPRRSGKMPPRGRSR